MLPLAGKLDEESAIVLLLAEKACCPTPSRQRFGVREETTNIAMTK